MYYYYVISLYVHLCSTNLISNSIKLMDSKYV